MKSLTMLAFRRRAKQTLHAVRRGERFLLLYRGQPVARLEPVARSTAAVPDDDPLLRVDDFAVDGPGGRLPNGAIDRLLYGA